MSRVVRGTKSVQTTSNVSIHPIDGNSSGLVIEGEIAAVRGYIGTFPGAAMDLQESEGFGRLEVRWGNRNADGTPEAPVYTWEIVGNEAQKSILELPRSLALEAPTLQLIKDKLNATTVSERDAVTLNDGDETKLYERLVNEADYYYHAAPVLRKTIAVSNLYPLTVAFAGIGQVWLAANLISNDGVPSPFNAMLSALDSAHEATPSGYTWGWLKKFPTITQRWGQKLEITQEWVAENWDTDYRYSLSS